MPGGRVGLAKVDGNTLTAKDGTTCEADAIILATGFHAVDMPIAERLYGADGVSLAQAWGGDMRALRGTTIAGFPQPVHGHRARTRASATTR